MEFKQNIYSYVFLIYMDFPSHYQHVPHEMIGLGAIIDYYVLLSAVIHYRGVINPRWGLGFHNTTLSGLPTLIVAFRCTANHNDAYTAR